MALIGYRVDSLRARINAVWHALLGLKVGRGAQIHPGTLLRYARGGSELGERAVLYRKVQVLCTGPGSFSIGRHSHIAPHGYLLVGDNTLRIGDHVAIGPYCTVFCQSNAARGGGLFCQQFDNRPVWIGSNVLIGAQVTVLPGSCIEDNVVVGANAVVRGHLESGWIYGGVPASQLKRIDAV